MDKHSQLSAPLSFKNPVAGARSPISTAKMSGRAYTMKEMSNIVNYVNTRKAYGEIRGRKLWTELASSNLTTRTWQSLKETFLKRILPDIHNPYYGLTKSEICSFKQGYDVDTRNKNKLEIQTISDDSNHSHADNVQDTEKPSTSNNNDADNSTGEKISPSTLDARTRASTETIILENCYETAEEIQRDLESPNNKKDMGSQDEKDTPNKCLRDLITYAEPFTPMMQQVLDDFEAEDDLVEAEMEILEKTNDRNEETCNKTNTKIEDKSQINKKNDEKLNEKVEDRLSEVVHCSDSIKIPLGQESKVSENDSARNSSDLIKNGNVKDETKKGELSLDKIEKNKDFVDLTNDTAPTQHTNNSTDTTIPGNQEALKNKNENIESFKIATTSKDVLNNLTRKRSFSLDGKYNIEIKKKIGLKSKNVAQSETEDKSEKKYIENKPEKNKRNNENKQTSDYFQNTEEEKVAETLDGNFSQINPCLNSVSLYDEQFNNTKYTDSDSSDNAIVNAIVEVHKEINKDEQDNFIAMDEEAKQKEKNEDINKEKGKDSKNTEIDSRDKNEKSPGVLKETANINEVVMLKSHSETDDSNDGENRVNQEKVKQVDKKEREKALANVFGFSSGVVSSSRKRKLSRLHRSPSYGKNASNSSEWTSESDSEYVSPPRGRRNRYSRKYLKPKSPRVLQLEEEGGLFVMQGKRIYPLVKDGRIVKNYLTFSPESDPEDDSAYWKKKYKEERKKTEELKRIVEEAKVKMPIREQSPILPTTSRQSILPQSPPPLIKIPDEPKVLMPPEKPKQEVKSHEKTLKIKFTKNNEELQLEGCWSQIHPVLADVVQIFNKDAEPKEVHSNINRKADADDIVSVRSSPLDEEEVRKKVEKMEEEIFKEIEELDKSEREQEVSTKIKQKGTKDQEASTKDQEASTKEKEASTKDQEASTKNQEDSTKEKEASTKDQEDSTKDQEANVNKRQRLGRSRKSSTALKTADSSSSPSRPRRTKADKTGENQLVVEKENGQQEVEKANEKENDQLAVDKELPKRRTRTPKKYNSDDRVAANEKSKKLPKSPRKSANPEPESTRPSLDDSQVRYMFPPAKKTRKSAAKTETANARSSKIPTYSTSENLTQNSIESSQGYQDSDPSPARERAMIKRKRKLSLSYILNRGKQRRFVRRRSYPCVADDASSISSNFSFKLPIKNTSASLKSDVYRSESYQLLMPVKKRSYTTLGKIDEITFNLDKNTLGTHVEAFDMNNSSGEPTETGHIRSDGNSSNISLPQSPELSIVQNISVSKELLDSIEDFPTINEMQANNNPNLALDNKYLISEVDVTMPLMEQYCNIQKSVTPDRLDYQINPATSESLLNIINSVNITEGPSISDSLNSRVRNLILDSAKKMEVDTSETINEARDYMTNSRKQVNKKSRAKSRCSTPHKRNSKKKSKVPDIEPVVEEERMEFCSYGGRKSCPPAILSDDIYNNYEHDGLNTENEPLKKGKKKKDVIKVKILRPSKKQKKTSPAKIAKKTSHDMTTISVHTDSGINETGSVFFQDTDDSVDLIHNHSETCLQTRECLDDSVEFVEANTSCISIKSQDAMLYLPPEGFSNNAHDGINITREKNINSQPTSETVYLSPLASELSANSLITEDLSDDNEMPYPRRNKWYLFSDDETTNTNHAPSFGANLMQIFPLTCAVPDLSTISEMSKENDSRKPTLDADGNTRNDLESQSIS